MISENLQNQIQSLRTKYINTYTYIPETVIKYCFNNKNWAKFIIEDLYEEDYVLYINNELEKQYPELIEQVIFHEFTHMADSLVLKSYDYEEFQYLMNIYSETHAGEIMMNSLLSTQNEPYSLNMVVKHNVELTLHSFMTQTLNNLEKSFSLQIALNQNMNYKRFYYFVGYLVSLKKHNIIFRYQFKNIDSELMQLFEQIINSFVSNDYDFDLLIQYEKNMSEKVLNIMHKMLNLPIVTCPFCQSNNTKKISTTSKVGSVALFGIFFQKVKKQWHCNNCKRDF